MKVGIVSGGFDPIRIGHLENMQSAKCKVDFLVVAVNPDEDMIRKKKWCFMPQEEKMVLIEAYPFVDRVVAVIPDEGSQGKTLQWLRKEYVNDDLFFCKGGDRDCDANMPQNEVAICKQLGIEIIYGCGGKISSSSNLVIDVVVRIMRQVLFEIRNPT